MPWSPGLLFAGIDSYSFTKELYRKIENEALGLDSDRVLSTPVADLVSYLVQAHMKTVPTLRDDLREVAEHGERMVEVPYPRAGPGGTLQRVANSFVFAIPYEGDAEFFGVTPKQFPINPPNAMVLAGEILVAVDLWDGQDEVVLQNELRQIIDRIKSYLDYLREEMAIFYRELPERISQLISTQRKKFLRNQNILASLNIPIRQRVDVPQVIPVSVSKRVLKRVLPPTPKEAFSPEPALPDESYEVILQTLQNMAVTMERSPSVFLRIKEEEVRDILLVSLNGIFEGGATGETFSSKGKTDIHILWEGKSIFIAELKFWKGQRSLTNALSQLLGYLTWRHTKTALIILNREGEFNHILEQIRLTAEAHSCFKRFLRIEDKTVFRFVFRNPTDSNQEISMTILAFDLPRAAASTKP